MKHSLTLLLCWTALVGCGSGGTGSGESSGGSPQRTYSISQGTGTLTIKPSFATSRMAARTLHLGSSATGALVDCEYNANTNYAWIRLGTFLTRDGRRIHSSPITGLAVTIPQIRSGGKIDVPETFFSVENHLLDEKVRSPISQPKCWVITKGLIDRKIEGQLSCIDSSLRLGWGIAEIDASFSCPMN